MIARKGTAGFSFAGAARFAGVSPAGPYRHFHDRDELMANVALLDSEQFTAALARACDDRRSDEFIGLPVSPFAKSIQADSRQFEDRE